MITNTIVSKRDARNNILDGVTKVADAVTSTLGPGGRNVMIEQPNGLPPIVTKDGVSVARSIRLDNGFANMGSQMLIEVASKTNSSCGDGTTTATLIASEMYKNAVMMVDKYGYEPMTVKREMNKSLEKVKDMLKESVIEIDNDEAIENVAKISANGDEEIGKMVAEIVKETGKDGIVVVEEGNNLKTTHTITKGMRLDSGFMSAYFATPNPEGKIMTTFENAYVLFYMDKISNVNELFPIMQEVISKKRAPFVVVAEDFEVDVISTLVVNKLQANMKLCAIKAPGVLKEIKKEKLTDAAIATGGTLISSDLGIKLQDVKIEHLGFVKKVEVTQTTTTFIDGAAKQDIFDNRVKELQEQMNDDSLDDYKRHNCRERLARLVGGIGVVKVGGETRSIIHEKRDRIDDAICATREAISGGIVAGAGITLLKIGLRLSQCLNEYDKVDSDKWAASKDFGDKIVGLALQSPFYKILDNAGYKNTEEAKSIVQMYIDRIRNSFDDISKIHIGYDVSKWVRSEDLVADGVIDPANVTLSAVTNAISVAALLISTDCMVGINKDSVPQIPPYMEQM